MYLLITIFIFVAAILLVLIVLVQNSKGGGLSSGFSSSNQVMGVRKTTDFLEKFTWTLAAAICILSIASAGFMKSDADVVKQSLIKDEVENAVNVDPNLTSPKFNEAPATAPAAEQAQTPEQAPASAPAAQK